MNKGMREHATEILKTTGHPLRLQIIDLLRRNEMCVGDIVKALDKKQEAVKLPHQSRNTITCCRNQGRNSCIQTVLSAMVVLSQSVTEY